MPSDVLPAGEGVTSRQRRDDGQVAGAATAPRWSAPIPLLTCLAGLAVAGYLTYAHFTATKVLACPDTGLVNCLKVTTSPESVLLGVPVALLGLLYFAGMALLCTPAAWRSPGRALSAARLVGVATGVAMVTYLIYDELFVLDALCLYCTAVHVLVVVLFTATVLATAMSRPRELTGP